MSIVKPEHVILDLVVEDSYAFPEVMSRVQAALSSLSPGDAKEIARKAVAEMLREGLIAVTRLESPRGPR